MAWFRRKRDDDAGAPDEGAPEASSGAPAHAEPSADPAGSSDVIRAERAHAGDWMAVPTIHSTIGPPPTTFRVQRLPEIMTTRRPTILAGELGHRVSSDAPSGVVQGLAAPLAPPSYSAATAELPLRAPVRPHEAETADLMPAAFEAPPAAATEPPAPSGAAEQIAPVVQRQLAVTSAPAPLAAPVRAASPLPEPSPSRVLRAPVLPPAPAERPAPPLPVVETHVDDAPVQRAVDTPAPHTPDLGAIAAPVGGDDQVAPLAAAAPITPSSPLGDVPTSFDGGATSIDLPLAAPGSDTPRSPRPADLMPPIQPRVVQRRVEETSQGATPPAAPRDELPPLPEWFRAGEGAPATPPPAPAAPSSAAMPLHQPVVQREAAETSAPPVPSEPGADASEGPADETGPPAGETVEATAPLAGAAPLATVADAVTPGSDDDGVEAASPVDLPLHAAASVQTERIDSSNAAGDAAPGVAATVDDGHHPGDGHDHGDHVAAVEDGADSPSSDAGGEEATAPLLGDRPLQLQRLADPSPVGPSSDTPPVDLPLAVDMPGPVLGDGPRGSSAGPVASAAPASDSGSAAASPAVAVPTLGRTLAIQRSWAPTAAGAHSPAATAPALASTRGAAATPAGAASGALPLRSLPSVQGPAPGTAASAAPVSMDDLGAASPAMVMPTLRSPQPAAQAPFAVQRERAVPTSGAPAIDLPLQRLAPPAAPASTASAGSTAQAFDSAISAGLATRLADGSVVFTQQAPPSDGEGDLPIQRAITMGSHRAAAPAPSAAASSDSAPPVSGGEAGPSFDEAGLDKLARQLYPRIRWKLEGELRNDRGRFGSGSWSRHGR